MSTTLSARLATRSGTTPDGVGGPGAKSPGIHAPTEAHIASVAAAPPLEFHKMHLRTTMMQSSNPLPKTTKILIRRKLRTG